MINNLALALSVFSERNVTVAATSRDHITHYHVYYHKDGKTRVMLVNKEQCDPMQLQREVGILLSRSEVEQAKAARASSYRKH